MQFNDDVKGMDLPAWALNPALVTSPDVSRIGVVKDCGRSTARKYSGAETRLAPGFKRPFSVVSFTDEPTYLQIDQAGTVFLL